MNGNDSLRTPSISENFGTKLVAIIQETLHYADALAKVLKFECIALKLRDISAINSLIDEKQRLISLIEAQESCRKRLLLTHGYSTDHQGMATCILNIDTRGQIGAMWQQVLHLINYCQHLNSVNGTLLNLSYRVVKNVLNLLHAEEPQNKLYNPIGREVIHNHSRIIAKF